MNEQGDRDTPVRAQSPVELLTADMQELKDKIDDTQITSKRTYDLLLLMNERDKSFDRRIRALEGAHIVLPIVSTVIATIALILIFALHHP